MDKLEHYVFKANQIINEVAAELGIPENKVLAGRILRAVFHTLRYTIPPAESFRLMSQLPLILKGIYVDGWNPYRKREKIETVRAFVREMVHEDFPTGHFDFSNVKDGENAIRAVFKVLSRHISPGEITDVQEMMSPDLMGLWDFRLE